jgi:serine/threonine protein kinase
MFRGICEDPLCIIVDFCEGGSLLSILRGEKNIENSEKIRYVTDIAKGGVTIK